MFATVDHDRHKVRRAALNPFFSTQNVRKLQPVIRERVEMMLKRIEDFRKSGEVLNASWLYAAFTNGRYRSQHKLTCSNIRQMLSCNMLSPDLIIGLVSSTCLCHGSLLTLYRGT